MGIEPTGHARYAWPNGFEDRARHQPWTHFRLVLCCASSCSDELTSFILTVCGFSCKPPASVRFVPRCASKCSLARRSWEVSGKEMAGEGFNGRSLFAVVHSGVIHGCSEQPVNLIGR